MTLIGITGVILKTTKTVKEDIKIGPGQALKLELSDEKTLITMRNQRNFRMVYLYGMAFVG